MHLWAQKRPGCISIRCRQIHSEVDDRMIAPCQRDDNACLVENTLSVFIIKMRSEDKIPFLRKLPLLNQKPAESQKRSIRMICFRFAYQLSANESADLVRHILTCQRENSSLITCKFGIRNSWMHVWRPPADLSVIKQMSAGYTCIRWLPVGGLSVWDLWPICLIYLHDLSDWGLTFSCGVLLWSSVWSVFALSLYVSLWLHDLSAWSISLSV